FYYSSKPVTVTVSMGEKDGTQTAAASLVKLSSAASPFSVAASPVKLSAAASPAKFSVSVSLVKLLHPVSPVKPSAAASPTKFFTVVSPLRIYVIYVVRLTCHIRSSCSLTV
ncbi:hypothetical protein HID58_060967, partial [Brassica napus]